MLSVFLPMEPVEPSMAMRFMRPQLIRIPRGVK